MDCILYNWNKDVFMHTLVSPDQRLQLNAALAVIQWKHAFTVRMQQRTSAAVKSDNRISGSRVPSLAETKVLHSVGRPS